MIRSLFYIGLILIGLNVYAWNATGHRVITQIALDQLSPVNKKKLYALNHDRKHRSLFEASVWLDKVRYVNPAFPKTMHFIDLPFSIEQSLPLPAIESMNIVVALRQAQACWFHTMPCTKKEKSIALRLILHLVGDIHQPLHAATRVSRAFPLGDQGGNLIDLPKNRVAPSLHAYWDRGAGLLSERLNRKEIRRLAHRIEERYPCDPVSASIEDPMQWARESHALAVSQVYQYQTPSEVLSPAYQTMADQLAMRQMALAGCRLAHLLRKTSD